MNQATKNWSIVVLGLCVALLAATTAVNLATDAVGVLPVNHGGTGTASTLTGFVRGNGSAMTATELSGDGSTSGSGVFTFTRLHNLTFGTQTAPACANGGGTTTFIGPGGSSTTEATVGKWPVTEAFTFSKLYVQIGANVPASETAAVTLMKLTPAGVGAGSAQTITASVGAATNNANDTAHSFTASAGDLVYAKIVCSGGTTALTPGISIGVGYK